MKKKLGELLRDRGQVTPENLSKALDEHHQKLVLLGEVLLQRGFVERPNLVAALQEVTKVSYVDCRSVQVDPDILKIIPRATAVRFCVLPLRVERHRLVVAMAEPQNMQILKELGFVGADTPNSVFAARFWRRSNTIRRVCRGPPPDQGNAGRAGWCCPCQGGVH
jgi:hypothetical protein